MRKANLISLIVLFLTLTSCVKNQPEETVNLTFDANALSIAWQGGILDAYYSLTNPAAEYMIEAECDAEWVTATVDTDNGKISMNVQENPYKDTRIADITIKYSDADTQITILIAVVQEAGIYDEVFEAGYMIGDYYGTSFSEAHNYFITFSDLEIDPNNYFRNGGTYFQFDLYGKAPSNTETMAMPAGTYTLGADLSAGTFSPYSTIMSVSEDGEYIGPYTITSGTLTVSEDNGTYTIIANVTADDGLNYYMRYNGPIGAFNDFSPKNYYSTLTGDYTADMSQPMLTSGMYFGDFYYTETSNWIIRLEPQNLEGDAFQIELCSDMVPFTDGIPTGTYTASTENTAGTFVPGSVQDFTMRGTCFYNYESGNLSNLMAPLTDGTITIVNNGNDQYEITLSCIDDSPESYTVSASWSGTLIMEDMCYYGAPSHANYVIRNNHDSIKKMKNDMPIK